MRSPCALLVGDDLGKLVAGGGERKNGDEGEGNGVDDEPATPKDERNFLRVARCGQSLPKRRAVRVRLSHSSPYRRGVRRS